MIASPATAARTGGRDLLAAALRDSRTRTLALLDAYVAALGEATLLLVLAFFCWQGLHERLALSAQLQALREQQPEGTPRSLRDELPPHY